MTIDGAIAELTKYKDAFGGKHELAVVIFDKDCIEFEAKECGLELTDEIYHELVEGIEAHIIYADENPVSYIVEDYIENELDNEVTEEE